MKSRKTVTLREHGQITLPADVRRAARAKTGDLFTAEVAEPDVIVLRRRELIDPSQAYFWTEEWQRAEREADEDIKRGRVKEARSAKELIRKLRL